MSRKIGFILLGLALLAACRNGKPENGEAIDIERAALRSGIDLEKNPGAAIKPQELVDGQEIRVVGVLREVGTARFSRLVLTPLANFDINLSLRRDEIKDFPRLVNRFVEVSGVVRVQKVYFGEIARDWYSLSSEDLREID